MEGLEGGRGLPETLPATCPCLPASLVCPCLPLPAETFPLPSLPLPAYPTLFLPSCLTLPCALQLPVLLPGLFCCCIVGYCITFIWFSSSLFYACVHYPTFGCMPSMPVISHLLLTTILRLVCYVTIVSSLLLPSPFTYGFFCPLFTIFPPPVFVTALVADL